MAERRGVRSSSRRITPTPQPPPIATVGPPARKRATRSASRDLGDQSATAKQTRRATRQTSVTSITSDSDHEARPARRLKKQKQKQKDIMADLPTVEEADTQIDLEDEAQTPPRSRDTEPAPHRSPGSQSQMSGTTAISSFSMMEAEALDSRLIQRHLPMLYNISTDFLFHLAPRNGRIDDDVRNIQEMRKPDSIYTKDYRDFEEDLKFRLGKFRSEAQQYIALRSVRRALYGPVRGPSATQSGLDLILYMGNLVVFAKQMIGSDRDEKEIWDALRELDRNQFPHLFLPALYDSKPLSQSSAGESSLIEQTFDLALELRTQLAISALERESHEGKSNPESIIDEVFLQSEDEGDSIIRGWDIPGLGDDNEELRSELRSKVVARIQRIRHTFPTDTESLERGQPVDLDSLDSEFPWESAVLKLLHWVRLRHAELQATIESLGGIKAIADKVRNEVERSEATTVETASKNHKSRTSFGRTRRRSGRKFDPHDTVNDPVIDALLQREQTGTAIQPVQQADQRLDEAVQQIIEEDFAPIVEDEPVLGGEVTRRDFQRPPPDPMEDDVWQQIEDHYRQPPEGTAAAEPSASNPPASSAAWASEFQKGKKVNKENQRRFIDRQANAKEVDFGTGFEDSQPGPDRASQSKGKQREQPTSPKRRREVEEESDEDTFETTDRRDAAHERRRKAPVAKKVRIEPGSSAPPSHQPPARKAALDLVPVPQEQEESLSEQEAPEMTEEPPRARSIYKSIKHLSQMNSSANAIGNVKRRVRGRVEWTEEAEQALIEYMAEYPRQYSKILSVDKTGHELLQDRSQVNLKDKVRNMAINMIKSGTGLQPGFEDIVTPDSSYGERLVAAGYNW